MTLSTSDIKTQRIAYSVATVSCLVFSTIYECFSHNVYSNYMTLSFLIPLLGLLLLEILLFFSRKKAVNKASDEMLQAFMAGAVIWLTLGSLFKGALEIYGTTNHLTILFPIIGILQFLFAIGCWIHGYITQ